MFRRSPSLQTTLTGEVHNILDKFETDSELLPECVNLEIQFTVLAEKAGEKTLTRIYNRRWKRMGAGKWVIDDRTELDSSRWI